MQSVLTLRIPDELKRVFIAQCEAQGYSASLVVRKMIEDYVAQNAQIDIFDRGKAKR